MVSEDEEDFASLFEAQTHDYDAEQILWMQVKQLVSPLNVRERVSAHDTTKPIRLRSFMDDYVYEAGVGDDGNDTLPLAPLIKKHITKGRIAIDITIDLHDMVREKAHRHLYESLHKAYHAKQRTALVITGKGKAGEGVLKKSLPHWLASPAFSGIVGSYAEAAQYHGGSGAFYVRLRA